MLKNYETVFILNPVLSEDQMKDAVGQYEQLLKEGGAEVINVEKWGLKKLAYPIQHKSTGFYNLMEYNEKRRSGAFKKNKKEEVAA